jgi:hypothetical protein
MASCLYKVNVLNKHADKIQVFPDIQARMAAANMSERVSFRQACPITKLN